MGAWGPAIFSDDTAEDIRNDYRQMLEDQVPDDEATERVIAAYEHLDDDEQHLLWLALAAAQSSVGRLSDDVKGRALQVIDGGRGLERWEEEGPRVLEKRKAALAKLRDQLTGPQRTRRKLRPPWRHVTDLQAGDVLALTLAGGELALVRVARIDDDRLGVAPVLSLLDWSGRSVPSDHQLRGLQTRYARDGSDRPMTYRPSVHRTKAPDWRDAGFEVVAKEVRQVDDGTVQPWSYCGWDVLASAVERDVRGHTSSV